MARRVSDFLRDYAPVDPNAPATAPMKLSDYLTQYDDPMRTLRAHSRHSFDTGTTYLNPDGRTSSVRSGSVEDPRINDGQVSLIPFLWDGKPVERDEAIERALASGEKWPTFETNDLATKASEDLSRSFDSWKLDPETAETPTYEPQTIPWVDDARAGEPVPLSPAEIKERDRLKGRMAPDYGQEGKDLASPQDVADIGISIYDAAVYHIPASVAALTEGSDVVGSRDLRDKLADRSRKRSAERYGQIESESIKPLAQSLGFSVTAGAVGLVTGVGTALGVSSVATPVAGLWAGYTAGGLASGTAAYRMATNMFVRDLYDAADAEQRKLTPGTGITDAAFQVKQEALADVIRHYGLWEAIPEGVANTVGFGIIKYPVKEGIKQIFGKTALRRVTTKFSAIQGGELATETTTQMGQQRAESVAGITPEPMRPFYGEGAWEAWKESFGEIAGPVFLQTTIMAGGTAVGVRIQESFNKKEASGRPRTALEVEEFRQQRIAELEARKKEAKGAQGPEAEAELEYLRNPETGVESIARSYGAVLQPIGVRERAILAAELTQGDIDSPIDKDTILDGKKDVQDALGAGEASALLEESGFPTVGTEVWLDKQHLATVYDAYETDSGEKGIKLQFASGQVMSFSLEDAAGRIPTNEQMGFGDEETAATQEEYDEAKTASQKYVSPAARESGGALESPEDAAAGRAEAASRAAWEEGQASGAADLGPEAGRAAGVDDGTGGTEPDISDTDIEAADAAAADSDATGGATEQPGETDLLEDNRLEEVGRNFLEASGIHDASREDAIAQGQQLEEVAGEAPEAEKAEPGNEATTEEGERLGIKLQNELQVLEVAGKAKDKDTLTLLGKALSTAYANTLEPQEQQSWIRIAEEADRQDIADYMRYRLELVDARRAAVEGETEAAAEETPAPEAEPTPDSQQFEAYQKWISEQPPANLAASKGVLEQIRMDERLEDGEAAKLESLWEAVEGGDQAPPVETPPPGEPEAGIDEAEIEPEPTADELAASDDGIGRAAHIREVDGKFNVYEDDGGQPGAQIGTADTLEEAQAIAAQDEAGLAPTAEPAAEPAAPATTAEPIPGIEYLQGTPTGAANRRQIPVTLKEPGKNGESSRLQINRDTAGKWRVSVESRAGTPSETEGLWFSELRFDRQADVEAFIEDAAQNIVGWQRFDTSIGTTVQGKPVPGSTKLPIFSPDFVAKYKPHQIVEADQATPAKYTPSQMGFAPKSDMWLPIDADVGVETNGHILDRGPQVAAGWYNKKIKSRSAVRTAINQASADRIFESYDKAGKAGRTVVDRALVDQSAPGATTDQTVVHLFAGKKQAAVDRKYYDHFKGLYPEAEFVITKAGEKQAHPVWVVQDGKAIAAIMPIRLGKSQELALKEFLHPTPAKPQPEAAIPEAGGLRVRWGDQVYPVESMEDATAKWNEFRAATNLGASELPRAEVIDSAGNVVAKIEYNGKITPETAPAALPPVAPPSVDQEASDNLLTQVDDLLAVEAAAIKAGIDPNLALMDREASLVALVSADRERFDAAVEANGSMPVPKGQAVVMLDYEYGVVIDGIGPALQQGESKPSFGKLLLISPVPPDIDLSGNQALWGMKKGNRIRDRQLTRNEYKLALGIARPVNWAVSETKATFLRMMGKSPDDVKLIKERLGLDLGDFWRNAKNGNVEHATSIAFTANKKRDAWRKAGRAVLDDEELAAKPLSKEQLEAVNTTLSTVTRAILEPTNAVQKIATAEDEALQGAIELRTKRWLNAERKRASEADEQDTVAAVNYLLSAGTLNTEVFDETWRRAIRKEAIRINKQHKDKAKKPGTKRGKKYGNTGKTLRRWFDGKKKNLDDAAGDTLETYFAALQKLAVRAELFSIEDLIDEGATPGLTRYLSAVRQKLPTLREHTRISRTGFDYVSDTEHERDKLLKTTDGYIELIHTIAEALQGHSTIEQAAKALRALESTLKDSEMERYGTASTISAYKVRDVMYLAWPGPQQEWQTPLPEEQRLPYKLKRLIKTESEVDAPGTSRTPIIRRKKPIRDLEREGMDDVRKGKNKTPKLLKAQFAFSDIVVGEYVTSTQEQEHVNASFEAWHDLSKLIGWTPKQMGMGGELFFAIGALGSGKWSAHYSPNHPYNPENDTMPTKAEAHEIEKAGKALERVQVINVTKNSGDGAVAHEFGHAIDWNMRESLDSSKMSDAVAAVVRQLSYKAPVNQLENMTRTVNSFLNGITYYPGMKRQGVVAMAEEWLNRKIGNIERMESRGGWTGGISTNYRSQALAGDKGSSDPYWSTGAELFARAFEAHIFDKMGEKQSEYLVTDFTGDGEVSPPKNRFAPYPADEERVLFNEIFNDFLEAISWQDGKLVADQKFVDSLKVDNTELLKGLKDMKANLAAMLEQLNQDKADAKAAAAKAEQEKEKAEAANLKAELEAIKAAEAAKAAEAEIEAENIEAEKPPITIEEQLATMTADELNEEIDALFANAEETAADRHHTEQTAAEAEKPAAPMPTDQDERLKAERGLAREMADHYDIRNLEMDWVALNNAQFFERGDRWYGGTRGEGTYETKDAYDALELGVNQAIWNAGAIIRNAPTVADVIGALDRLTLALPTQSNRSEKQVEWQQFSTPPSYSYVVGWVANISGNDIVLEPSAGTGALHVHAKIAGAQTVVNELDFSRSQLLAQLEPDVIKSQDARYIGETIKDNEKPTIVLMNPPFSADVSGGTANATKQGAKHIDSALLALQDGGRLVAIVGKGMERGKPAFKAWWAKIEKKYTVKAAIRVDGKVYRKYGTSFDNVVLVIDKLVPNSESAGAIVGGRVESITELAEKLQEVRDARVQPTSDQPSVRANVQGPQPAPEPGPTPSAPPDATLPGTEGTRPGDEGPGGVSTGPAGRDRRGEPGPADDVHGGERDDVTGPVRGPETEGRGPTGATSPALPGGRTRAELSVSENLANAASHGFEFSKGVVEGLDALFGGKGKVNSFPPGWDENTWAQAKPIFEQAYQDAVDLGLDLAAAMKKIADDYGAVVEPYLRHWLQTRSQDIQGGDKRKVPPKIEPEEEEIVLDDSGAPAKATDLTTDIYENYTPTVAAPGAQPHPAELVETASMADVKMPAVNFVPNLPDEVLASGAISDVQSEVVVMAGAAHEQMLPEVEGVSYRKGFLTGDGTGFGKTRELLGVIIHNRREGRTKSIVISKNDGLLNDLRKNAEIVGLDKNLLIPMSKVKGKISADEGILYITYGQLGRGMSDAAAAAATQFVVNRRVRRINQDPADARFDYVSEPPPADFTVGQRVGERHNPTRQGTVVELADEQGGGFVGVKWDDGALVIGHMPNRLVAIDESAPAVAAPETGQMGTVVATSVKGMVKVMWDGTNAVVEVNRRLLATEGEKVEPGNIRLNQIKEWLGENWDGALIYDEAHFMANSLSAEGGFRGRGGGTVAAQAVAGVQLAQELPNARVLYATATAAQEVRHLAYMDRLGLWGPGTPFADKTAFIAEFDGDTRSMEFIAMGMKSMGVYMSRTISFKGVGRGDITHVMTDDQREIYDEIARAWRVVLNNMQQYAEQTGADKDSQTMQHMTSLLWGFQQRFFSNLIITMKLPSIINDAKQKIADGGAAVFQIVKTGKAPTDRAIARMEQSGGDLQDIDVSGKDDLIEMVHRAFPVQLFEDYTTDEGKAAVRPVFIDGEPVLDPEAVAARDQLEQNLRDIRIPQAPLDILIEAFGADNIAEVTGRDKRIVRNKDGELEIQTTPNQEAEIDKFQDGKKFALVFSNAGNTGKGYHSDLERPVAGQRKRYHYVVEAGWSATQATQGFGRDHRSNQRVPPDIYPTSSDIKAEKRFSSSIARRLDALGALAKGSRKAGGDGMYSAADNLENEYAEGALRSLLDAIAAGNIEGITAEDLWEELGLDILSQGPGGGGVRTVSQSDLPPIRKFLNRLLSVPIDKMNLYFDAFYERLENAIEVAVTEGTYDVGVENLVAEEVKIVHRETVHLDMNTQSETDYIKFELTDPVRYRTLNEVMEMDGIGTRQLQFFAKNKKSGKPYAFFTAPDVSRDGGVVRRWRRVSISASGLIDQSNIRLEGDPQSYNPNYERIEAADLQETWDEAIAGAPEYQTWDEHMIVGSLLPIWDRLIGRTKIYRTVVDGKRFLGRVVHRKDLEKTLQNLGAGGAAIKSDAATIITRVKAGYTYGLSNNWRLERKRVGKEYRVRIIGPGYGASARQAEQFGAMSEIIEGHTLFFANEAVMQAMTDSNIDVVEENAPGKEKFAIRQGAAPARKAPAEPWYFSALTRAAEGLKQEKGQPLQMLAMLRKQPGVKQEEIEWTGLPEFLRTKGKSVTKAEIVEFLEGNGVQIEEVLLGDETGDIRLQEAFEEAHSSIYANLAGPLGYHQDDADAFVYRIYFGELTEEDLAEMHKNPAMDLLAEDAQDAFVARVAEAGQTFEEWAAANSDSLQAADSDEAHNRYLDYLSQGDPLTDTQATPFGAAKYKKYTLDERGNVPEGENYREIIFKLPTMRDREPRPWRSARDYTVSKWPQAEASREYPPATTYAELGAERQKAFDKMFGDADSYRRRQRHEFTTLYGGETPQIVTELPEGFHVGTDPMAHRDERYHILPPNQSHARPYGGNFARFPTAQAATEAALQRYNAEVFNKWLEENPRRRAYKDPHYSNIEGMFAHMRLIDRRLPNGDLMLTIEEFQAQHHADLRSLQIEIRKAEKKLLEVEGQYKLAKLVEYAVDEQGAFSAIADAAEKGIGIDRAKKHLDSLRADLERMPDAPFKGNAWIELAFKRVLRLAAEGGYDVIGWTTGAQQADRYDLSKRVEDITYMKNGENYRVHITGIDGPVLINRQSVKPEELPGIVGKEITEKILAGEGTETTYSKLPVKGAAMVLMDEDLKVGGESKKTLYDKQIPNIIRKILKKLDKGVRIGSVNLGNVGARPMRVQQEPQEHEVRQNKLPYPDVAQEWFVVRNGRWLDQGYATRAEAEAVVPEPGFVIAVDMTGQGKFRVDADYGEFATEAAAQAHLDKVQANAASEGDVWAVPVTAAMKRKALEGLPLFSVKPAFTAKAGVIEADLRARLKQVGIADRIATKVVEHIRNTEGDLQTGVEGRYFGRLIEVAASAKNGMWVMNHEVIHALRELGLINKSEWKTLERKARGRLREIRKRYADQNLDEEELIEEAVADMHADWTTGSRTVGGFVRTAFERIRDFLEALGAALRGAGFESVSDIFDKIDRGEVGARTQAEGATEAFDEWFGDSKVVDAEGQPLTVYHGTMQGQSESFDDPDFMQPGGGQFTEFHGYSLAGWFSEDANLSNRRYAGVPNELSYGKQEAVAAGVASEVRSSTWSEASRRVNAGEIPILSAARLYPVHLSIQNPINALVAGDMDAYTTAKEAYEAMGLPWPEGQYQPQSPIPLHEIVNSPQFVEDAKAAGYDGVVVNEDRVRTWGAFDSEQIKSATGNRGTFDPAHPDIRFAQLWHGGPHVFDMFKMEAIGTGEGVSAVAWGLYLAEEQAVSQGYKDDLTTGHKAAYYGNPQELPEEAWTAMVPTMTRLDIPGDISPNQSQAGMVREMLNEYGEQMTAEERAVFEEYAQAEGALYEVEIDDAAIANMIDWDARFSAQPQVVKEAFESLLDRYEPVMSAGLKGAFDSPVTVGAAMYDALVVATKDHTGETASRALLAAGVTGVRFLDQQSRYPVDQGFIKPVVDAIRGKGGPTRNMVLFDTAPIIQVKREGEITFQRGSKERFALKAGDFNPKVAKKEAKKPTKPPRNRALAQAVSNATAPPARDSLGGRFLLEAQFRFQDKYNYLARAQRTAAAERGLPQIPEAEDAYLAEMRYHGMAGAAIEDFQRDYVDPLVEAISVSGLTMEEIDSFLHARHAPEANEQLERINPDLEDNTNLSGLSNAEAEDILDGFEAEGYTETLQQLAGIVDSITHEQRRLLVDSGLESQDSINNWEATYEYYVPLHREGFEGTSQNRGKGFSVPGKQKRRAGSHREVVHILAQLVSQHEATIVRAEKNKVGQAMLEFARNNPNPDLYKVNKVELKPTFGKDGLVTYRPDMSFKYADNVLVVKVDGKDHTVTFNERDHSAARMVYALNNLGAGAAGPVLGTLMTITRYLAFVNTGGNPEFIISNFARDIQTAGYNLSDTAAAHLKWQIIRDVGKAWNGIRQFQKGNTDHEWAKYFDEFRHAGAKTGWMDFYSDVGQREDSLVKLITEMDGTASMLRTKKTMRGVIKFIEDENTAVENGIRLSAFVHARQDGISVAESARLAKELTVNFNKKGDYGQTMNALWLFYNASIQGSARMLLAGYRSPAVRKLMGATVVAAMFLDMANRALSDDDDDGKNRYDKIPPWVKERNLIIMRPGGDGDYIKIPLPWGYNVFHVIGQVIGEAIMMENFDPSQGGLRVASAVVGSFNPVGGETSLVQLLSPTVFDPVVQWATNEDWAGRPLYPESNQFDVAAPKSQQYWNSVREPTRWITEKLNELTGGSEIRPGGLDVNPELIDMLIDTFTGGAGRFFADAIATPIKALKGEDVESYEVPLLRKVYGRPGLGQLFEEYYHNADAVRITEKEAKHYLAIDDQAAHDQLEQERPGEYYLINARIRTDREISRLRTARRAIEADTNATEADKKGQLEDIGAMIESLMNDFNRAYNERVE